MIEKHFFTCESRIAQELINDIASASGASSSQWRRGFQEDAMFVQMQKGLERNGKADCNLRRGLVRNLLKATRWPKLYVQDVRCLNPKSNEEEPMALAFILPQEILSVIAAKADREVLMSTERMDPLSKAHLGKCQDSAGEQLLSIGMWGGWRAVSVGSD